MTALNDLDSFRQVMGVIDGLPQTGDRDIYLEEWVKDRLIDYKQYIGRNGKDMPDIWNWERSNPT